MSQQHKDILTVIERHGPISTSEICEHLSMLGYGGAMSWQDFRGSISKQLCYLRDKGDIAGEDKPQSKGKPMRVWSLAKVQEMASDLAEVEAVTEDYSATVQESVTVAETVTPEPLSVEVTLERKMPISVRQAMVGMPHWMDKDDSIHAFMRGIEFAEKHHGISQ